METLTFAKVVENVSAGTELERTNWKGEEEIGIWTGKSVIINGVDVTYVYNIATKTVQSARVEDQTDWRVRYANNNAPFKLSEVGAMLAECVGQERINYVSLNKRLDIVEREFGSFKSNAHELLCDWALGGVLSDESLKEFSDVLESIGLEGIKRDYTVAVTVTYKFDFTVEASSEDAAREMVDNDLLTYIRDEMDSEYWDDYNIDDVCEV